ncbi:IS630 transposase-related protein [Symbiopectobacterium sp. RP]|uniref:IS630 transposase-related protein n=1 Tax=Symbiopectobacterium sp. RP TaxID=3248553 RepID=UPI003D2AD28E
MSYSIDFRRKVISTREEEGLSIRETAKQFRIGPASVSRWINQIASKASTTRQRKSDKSELIKVVFHTIPHGFTGIPQKVKSLYTRLCNCLILICSIQHQKQVTLWTKNSYRLWLTSWPKISKPLTISISLIAC